MERKKKDHKIAPASTDEPDHLLSKEEQNQPNVTLGTKSMAANSPSNDNVPSVVQWPYTSQSYGDQPTSTSKPCISSQSPPSIAVSQWDQLPHLPLNPANQRDHLLPHLAQSPTSLWLPHPRPGYHLPGVNAPPIFHPYAPPGNSYANWQPFGLIGGGTSSKDHPQVPNFGNPFGYAFPGFPGPWDPSPWWGQAQFSQPPSTYAFPGSYGYLSSQHPMMPSCSTSIGQSPQRGIIRPLAKLSQKHQVLWEAQSAENVQLWTVISQLQSDIADYKSRLVRLEEEVSSLKQAIQEPTVHISGTAVSGRTSKRGRPRRSAALVDALPSLDGSQPSTQGRKPKAQIFEKVILKAENKEKPVNTTAIAWQREDKVPNAITNNISDSRIKGSNMMMPSFHNQVHKENNGMQMCGVDLSTSLEIKNNEDKIADTSDAFAILAQQTKGMDHRTALASCHAARNNGSLGWPYAIPSEGDGRNILNMTSQGFYNNGNVVKEGEKVIPEWGLVNEEDASDELEDTLVVSAKDDNEEEMGDDGSSGGEEIACSKGENLPPFSNW